MTFPILLFAYLFSQFFRSFLTIVAGDLTRDLGYGPAELGWISSSWFIAFAVFQFPVGYLLDTTGPRRTMGGLMLVGVVGALVFALSHRLELSMLGMALIGIGCSPMLMASLYIFGRTEPPERFAILSSLIVGLGNCGNLVAATPLTLAAQTFGWRWSMTGVGLLLGLSAVLVLLMLKDPPRAERSDGGRSSFLGDLAAIAKIRVLWLSFPIHLISYGVIATERGLWVGPYLEAVHKLDPITRGNIVFAMSIGMAAGALLCAPASRWFGGVKTPAVIGNALTVTLFLLLGAIAGIGVWAAAVILFFVGMFGLTYSLLLSHGRQFFPDHLLGRGVTWLNFLAIGGAGLMQAATGRYMEAALAAGATPVEAFSRIHLGLGLAALVALVLFLRVPARPVQA